MDFAKEYRDGRQEVLQKCLEAVWDICQPNANGPYSEGQYDACEEVAKAIQEMQKSELPECWKSDIPVVPA